MPPQIYHERLAGLNHHEDHKFPRTNVNVSMISYVLNSPLKTFYGWWVSFLFLEGRLSCQGSGLWGVRLGSVEHQQSHADSLARLLITVADL